MTKLPFAVGDRVRVPTGLSTRAADFGIDPNQSVIVVDAQRLAGDGPTGRVRVRLPTDEISDWIEAGNFEPAPDAQS